MDRIAKCSCGQLTITLKGDPKIVAVCSCLNCQRRTGSVFGVSAYFDGDQEMERSGEYKTYADATEDGKSVTKYFCLNCGSTVFWQAEYLPHKIGVAVGCFADPNFPQPYVSVWNANRHNWVLFPESWKHSDTQMIK